MVAERFRATDAGLQDDLRSGGHILRHGLCGDHRRRCEDLADVQLHLGWRVVRNERCQRWIDDRGERPAAAAVGKDREDIRQGRRVAVAQGEGECSRELGVSADGNLVVLAAWIAGGEVEFDASVASLRKAADCEAADRVSRAQRAVIGDGEGEGAGSGDEAVVDEADVGAGVAEGGTGEVEDRVGAVEPTGAVEQGGGAGEDPDAAEVLEAAGDFTQAGRVGPFDAGRHAGGDARGDAAAVPGRVGCDLEQGVGPVDETAVEGVACEAGGAAQRQDERAAVLEVGSAEHRVRGEVHEGVDSTDRGQGAAVVDRGPPVGGGVDEHAGDAVVTEAADRIVGADERVDVDPAGRGASTESGETVVTRAEGEGGVGPELDHTGEGVRTADAGEDGDTGGDLEKPGGGEGRVDGDETRIGERGAERAVVDEGRASGETTETGESNAAAGLRGQRLVQREGASEVEAPAIRGDRSEDTIRVGDETPPVLHEQDTGSAAADGDVLQCSEAFDADGAAEDQVAAAQGGAIDADVSTDRQVADVGVGGVRDDVGAGGGDERRVVGFRDEVWRPVRRDVPGSAERVGPRDGGCQRADDGQHGRAAHEGVVVIRDKDRVGATVGEDEVAELQRGVGGTGEVGVVPAPLVSQRAIAGGGDGEGGAAGEGHGDVVRTVVDHERGTRRGRVPEEQPFGSAGGEDAAFTEAEPGFIAGGIGEHRSGGDLDPVLEETHGGGSPRRADELDAPGVEVIGGRGGDLGARGEVGGVEPHLAGGELQCREAAIAAGERDGDPAPGGIGGRSRSHLHAELDHAVGGEARGGAELPPVQVFANGGRVDEPCTVGVVGVLGGADPEVIPVRIRVGGVASGAGVPGAERICLEERQVEADHHRDRLDAAEGVGDSDRVVAGVDVATDVGQRQGGIGGRGDRGAIAEPLEGEGRRAGHRDREVRRRPGRNEQRRGCRDDRRCGDVGDAIGGRIGEQVIDLRRGEDAVEDRDFVEVAGERARRGFTRGDPAEEEGGGVGQDERGRGGMFHRSSIDVDRVAGTIAAMRGDDLMPLAVVDVGGGAGFGSRAGRGGGVPGCLARLAVAARGVEVERVSVVERERVLRQVGGEAVGVGRGLHPRDDGEVIRSKTEHAAHVHVAVVGPVELEGATGTAVGNRGDARRGVGAVVTVRGDVENHGGTRGFVEVPPGDRQDFPGIRVEGGADVEACDAGGGGAVIILGDQPVSGGIQRGDRPEVQVGRGRTVDVGAVLLPAEGDGVRTGDGRGEGAGAARVQGQVDGLGGDRRGGALEEFLEVQDDVRGGVGGLDDAIRGLFDRVERAGAGRRGEDDVLVVGSDAGEEPDLELAGDAGVPGDADEVCVRSGDAAADFDGQRSTGLGERGEPQDTDVAPWGDGGAVVDEGQAELAVARERATGEVSVRRGAVDLAASERERPGRLSEGGVGERLGTARERPGAAVGGCGVVEGEVGGEGDGTTVHEGRHATESGPDEG